MASPVTDISPITIETATILRPGTTGQIISAADLTALVDMAIIAALGTYKTQQ